MLLIINLNNVFVYHHESLSLFHNNDFMTQLGIAQGGLNYFDISQLKGKIHLQLGASGPANTCKMLSGPDLYKDK